jgi:hypothetical protein
MFAIPVLITHDRLNKRRKARYEKIQIKETM